MQPDITNNLIMAEFYISAKKLDFEQINSLMDICASYIRKSESFKFKEFAKDEWCISTNYIECEDINTPLNLLEKQISNKREIINMINQAYSAECGFVIVVKITSDILPAIYYEREFIKLASEINASINMDFV